MFLALLYLLSVQLMEAMMPTCETLVMQHAGRAEGALVQQKEDRHKTNQRDMHKITGSPVRPVIKSGKHSIFILACQITNLLV